MFDLRANAAELTQETTSSVSTSSTDLPKPSGLGFDVNSFVFYLVCFFIALFVLQRFLFSRVAEAITKREERIASAEARAIELEEFNAEAETAKQKIITDAQEEARKIRQEAAESVGDEKQKIIDAANYMGEQILADHKLKAEEVLKQAQLNSESEAIKVVETIYKKSVGNLKIDTATQEKALDQIISSL